MDGCWKCTINSVCVCHVCQQAVVSVPLRSQPASSPVQVPTTLSVSAVTVAKPQSGSPGSPANNPASPAMLQGVTSPNIKQVEHFSFNCIYLGIYYLKGPLMKTTTVQQWCIVINRIGEMFP